jgi:RNA ligase
MESLKERLYKKLPTITLEEYEGYLNEVELGYIKANPHPEDSNLVILNYTESTTFEKRWNEYTMNARGLIIDITNAKDNGLIYILARPFGKFPNYSEMPEYEKDIDFTQIESVTEKMDGSLGISYFFNDEIRFATRGSFTSEQAIRATEIWKKKYAQHENLTHYVYSPVTYLVEIIYPEHRIVVNYGEREELVMLGTMFLFADDGIDAKYEHIEWEANRLHMPVTKNYKLSLNELLELKDKLTANEEGFVIKFKNDKRLKIKGDQYLHVHRLLHGVSDKAKFKAWSTGAMNNYIMSLPEEFRPELEEFSDKLDCVKDSLYILLQTLFEMISLHTTDKKSFALMVKQAVIKEYRKFMFEAYKNGSVSVQEIREHIAKNYAHYLEVIKWNSNDL